MVKHSSRHEPGPEPRPHRTPTPPSADPPGHKPRILPVRRRGRGRGELELELSVFDPAAIVSPPPAQTPVFRVAGVTACTGTYTHVTGPWERLLSDAAAVILSAVPRLDDHDHDAASMTRPGMPVAQDPAGTTPMAP
jgi:hypothetical protein